MSVDLTTPVEVERPLTAAEARALTDELRQTLRVGHDLLIRAFHGHAWAALGYESWDAYCAGEFAEARMVRLDREQRREIAAEMRSAGMSQRAIASGLGVSRPTVADDLRPQGGRNLPPADDDRSLTPAECEQIERERIRGSDGKSYPASRPEPVDRDTGEIGPRVPASRPRVDVAGTVNAALTGIDAARRRLDGLTAAQVRTQSSEARSSWAANLAEQLEALHGFLDALNNKEK